MDFSHLKELVRDFWSAVRKVRREPRARWAVLISWVGLAMVQVVVTILVYLNHDEGLLVELALIPIGFLIVALGHKAAKEAHNMPSGERFLLRQIGEIKRHRSTLQTAKAAAIDELLMQLVSPKVEVQYIGEVLNAIRSSSVWAVCGRKSATHAADFWDANIYSISRPDSDHPTNGKYIERIFFPPNDSEEVASIEDAITRHLNQGQMLVRAFTEAGTAAKVFKHWNLPAGFGMTLLGASIQTAEVVREPVALNKVLIHWGGITGMESHFGVILTHDVWTDHFLKLFRDLRGSAPIANAAGNPPRLIPLDWPAFIAKLRHYRKAVACD